MGFIELFKTCILLATNGYFSTVKADKYQHTTDQELLEQFYADHNNEWLGILLQRYTLLLLGVSMKYLKNEEEAKDSVQQIFLKVIQELQKYKVEYFKSWLYMVAKNHCLMKLRERQGKITAEISDKLTTKPEEETDLQALVANDHTLELMELALKELNPEQQQCVTLFYLQKKSYQEVSDETGYSMLQVKSYIQNGKRNLKILIEKKLSDESDSPLPSDRHGRMNKK
ncbi:MAG: sigma-70 family RNA polymerase sigma factor [Bacteroidota bacterium]|nr:sigma-70 family RNA polymerase sigma factor [Bacteroidota bacterium]